MLDVDSSPKSLLALTGNESAHGLYDFLLNYRSLMRMQSGMDVPVLCSPFPFLNAALASPKDIHNFSYSFLAIVTSNCKRGKTLIKSITMLCFALLGEVPCCLLFLQMRQYLQLFTSGLKRPVNSGLGLGFKL
ncbi:hypothetical protein vseg_000956 [Gypsophila vaccaria]